MSSDKKLRERVKALGKRPGKADMEKFVQDITPQQRKEMQLRWVKADIGPGEDGRVCLSLVADLTAGKPMSKDGHVSVSSSAMFGVPTLIGSLHVDALSYLEECGCCGEKGKELRHCSACYLVKYCGRQCQVRDWKDEHKGVCKALQTNGPGSPLDFTAFDWRVALKHKLEGGCNEEELRGQGILWALRGRTIEEVRWGLVDKHRQAIPPGVTVGIHGGGKRDNEAVFLTGPKTVEQVMDVILRTVRRESPHKTYTDTDLRLSSTCNDCPYNAFVGFQPSPPYKGMNTYRTLWSLNMCRTGGVNPLRMPSGPLRALDIVPERGINRVVGL